MAHGAEGDPVRNTYDEQQIHTTLDTVMMSQHVPTQINTNQHLSTSINIYQQSNIIKYYSIRFDQIRSDSISDINIYYARC